MLPSIDHPTKEVYKKDRVDLRSFPYTVTYCPSYDNIPKVINWLRKNVGYKSIKWTRTDYRIRDGNKTYFVLSWRFKSKDDLTLFKLTWL